MDADAQVQERKRQNYIQIGIMKMFSVLDKKNKNSMEMQLKIKAFSLQKEVKIQNGLVKESKGKCKLKF